MRSWLRLTCIGALAATAAAGCTLKNVNVPPDQLMSQVQAGQPGSVIEKTAEKVEGLLSASGANLVHARYPYDLFGSDTPGS